MSFERLYLTNLNIFFSSPPFQATAYASTVDVQHGPGRPDRLEQVWTGYIPKNNIFSYLSLSSNLDSATIWNSNVFFFSRIIFPGHVVASAISENLQQVAVVHHARRWAVTLPLPALHRYYGMSNSLSIFDTSIGK